MRIRSLILAAAFSPAAAASPDAELGVRYWWSSGMTKWAHSAQDANPSLGNPTSILTYTKLDANVIELHGRRGFDERSFVKGNLGIGSINKGSFDDEDYFAGQVKFSDSTSAVRGDGLMYFTLDLGRELGVSGDGRTAWDFFVGLSYWRERADAYGAIFTLGGGAPIPDNVLVISNEAMWTSLRIGLAVRHQARERLRFSAELALVPYTQLRNEDSHYLRQSPNDLGPVPNVFNKGSGYGLQTELEVRWTMREHYELGLGARYWWLKTTNGTNSAAGSTFPLVYQESERAGVLLSLLRRW